MFRLIARLQSNPLLMREMYRPTKLTIRAGLKYGFILGWFVSGAGLIVFTSSNTSPIRLFLGLFALLILAIPPFLGYAAAVATVNATRGQQFDLLRVTALSNYRLIEGYILISLYRFKQFFALVIGFAPLLILWTAAISVYDCQFPAFCPSPNLSAFFITLVGFILLAVNVIGMCLFNTIVGVLLAIALPSRIVAGVGALMVGLLTTPLYVLAASGRTELLAQNLLLLPIIVGLCGLMIWRASPLVRVAS